MHLGQERQRPLIEIGDRRINLGAIAKVRIIRARSHDKLIVYFIGGCEPEKFTGVEAQQMDAALARYSQSGAYYQEMASHLASTS